MMVICIKQHLSNIWRLAHEKAKQHWWWLAKKHCLWKKRLKLNCRRFSYFQPFSHDIITQNTTHSNMYIFIGAIPQARHLESRRESTKKATKRHRGRVQSRKWYPSHKFFYILFSVTQSFLLGFSWSSDSITAINKKSTSKKEPTSVSEITI